MLISCQIIPNLTRIETIDMKYKGIIAGLLFIGILLLGVIDTQAQVSDSTYREAFTVPVTIQFKSECCGVPSDSNLRVFIKSFRKKNKIKRITALRIGPMGREGEYWLAFSLRELNQKQKTAFIKKIKPVIEKLKKPGMASVEEQFTVDPSSMSSRTTITKVSF